MTNSMIPYSFVPGTKAKATEVNANFVSLANAITETQETEAADINSIIDTLATKAEKSELIRDFVVTKTGEDLNDYKTPGSYGFKSSYTPENIPAGSSGILSVIGDTGLIKQIWYGSGFIYTRHFTSAWSDWICTTGTVSLAKTGYIKLPSKLIIQYGYNQAKTVTYPIAFTKYAAPVFMKHGTNENYERTDTGFSAKSLTGFSAVSYGYGSTLNYVAIGY